MIDRTASILDAYDTLDEAARRHTPGGELLGDERRALIKRVALNLRISIRDVDAALAERHGRAACEAVM